MPLTTVVNQDLIISVGAGGDTSDVSLIDDSFPGGLKGTVKTQKPPYVTSYGVTLVNTESEPCEVRAIRLADDTTEKVTLAGGESFTLALKISANKTIGDVYAEIVGVYEGGVAEINMSTVVTEDISIDLIKPEL